MLRFFNFRLQLAQLISVAKIAIIVMVLASINLFQVYGYIDSELDNEIDSELDN